MDQEIRVLLAEDVAADAELEVRQLKRAGLGVLDRVVDSEPLFRGALRDFAPDVILSDFSMPGFDGMQALAIAREQCPEVPFIFVSGTLGEEHAVRALKSGAVDYVLKHNLIRLPSAVERAVREAQVRQARQRAEADLSAARERLAAIMASLQDVVWSVDPASGQLLYASPAAQRLYGVLPEHLMADADLRFDMIHPADAGRVRREWQSVLDGEVFDVEYRIVRSDGAVRWVHDRGQLVPGPTPRVDGIARDVTEQAEQRLRIARLSNIRDVLGAVNNAIVRIRDRDELLDEACRIAADAGGLRLASIGVPDQHGPRISCARAGGSALANPGDMAAEIEQVQGLMADTIARSAVVVHEEAGASLPEHCAVRSSAAFPLVVDGAVIGAFALHSAEPGYFDQEEVRLLKEVSGNIAFALSLIEKQERLDYLAYYDPLTGLPNRNFFRSTLVETLQRAAGHGHYVAVIALDIARFKAVNDAFGQQGGDVLLQELAARLKSAAGEQGRVARVSGDRFFVLIPLSKGLSQLARTVLDRLSSSWREPFRIDARELRISVRAGIAVSPHDGDDADTLFRNAEAALAKSRETGDRMLFYAPDMNARFAERLEIENRLRRAVERGELSLVYQPKVDAEERGLVALEALMRWDDPEAGLTMPSRFIPILEDTGLIAEAGRWAMQEAVATQAHWRQRGWSPPRIAVNVSALQLRRTDFVDEMRRLLEPLPESERGLDIEITESLLLEDVASVIEKLNDIRNMGVEVAIDDFGTGYSSLAYINKLPIHQLKIDRSFVSGMSDHGDSNSIVSAIIALAQGLKLKVVAEGVETEEQARLLSLLHCDQFQGFLTGRPMSRDEVERRFLAPPEHGASPEEV